MSGFHRWVIPTDWTEEDGYLTVFFCIPNSRQWRGLITTMINDLTYGRRWDETTGSIKDVQDIGREIFNSMAMCDFEQLIIDVGRVADSLESLDDKTPELYTISEMLTAMAQVQGVDFEEIEAMLNILGLLPGIDVKIDPLKYILQWIWRSQVLTNMYAQSTAQATIAASVGTGEVVDVVDDIYDGILGGGGAMIEAISTGSSLLTAITGILDLFDSDAPEEGRNINNVYNEVFVEGDSLAVTIQNFVNACCEGATGTTPDITEWTYGDDPPPGYTETIDTRKCQAANFLWQAMYDSAEGMSVYGLTSDISWASISALLASVADLLGYWLATVSLDTVGLFVDLVNYLFNTDFEATPFNMAQELIDHRTQIICELYAANSTFAVESAFTNAIPEYATYFEAIITNSNAAILWNKREGDLYEDDILNTTIYHDCTGCVVQESYLYTFIEAVSHQTEFGGTMYGMSAVQNTQNALHEPDGQSAYFKGSYWVEVVYQPEFTVDFPSYVQTTGSRLHAAVAQLWINETPGASWNSPGWVQITGGTLFSGFVNDKVVGTVKYKCYGDSGYEAEIWIDGCHIHPQ